MSHTFGTLDLTDTTKYRAPAAGARIVRPRARIVVPLRTGSAALAMDRATSVEISFTLLCTGATYQATLTNFEAIRTKLQDARDYQLLGTGSAITYVEQILNQSSAKTYTVLTGDYDLTMRLATTLFGGILSLICTE